jgi:hypothetical protein
MAGVSQVEYARHIGKTRQYVNKLVKDGRIPLLPDGRIDPEAADAAWKAVADPSRRLGPAAPEPPDDDDGDGESGAGPGARGPVFARERAEAAAVDTRIKRLDLAERLGQLVRKDEVELDAFSAGRAVRDRLMTLPLLVAGRLAGMGDEAEISRYLRAEIGRALEDAQKQIAEGDPGDDDSI